MTLFHVALGSVELSLAGVRWSVWSYIWLLFFSFGGMFLSGMDGRHGKFVFFG